jgi:hypothetical protein
MERKVRAVCFGQGTILIRARQDQMISGTPDVILVAPEQDKEHASGPKGRNHSGLLCTG